MGSDGAPPLYVRRFSATERAVHWVHASAFLALATTGLVLYVPRLSELVGRRPLVKEVHLLTAAAWALALVLVVSLGDRRALRRALREIDGFDADDRRWLRRRPGVPQGRFNAGQKLNAVVTGAFALLFAVSGTLLWLGERDTRFRLDGSLVLHDTLTLVSLVLLLGHLHLALVNPSTRHSLRGITLGTVRRDWAREHHRTWMDDMPRG